MKKDSKYRFFPVLFILLVTLFLRVWRIDTDLLIHYDQGRDLMAAYQIWKLHQPTLLGAATDTPGVYTGPIYYYLISLPLYLTNGHPVSAIVFLILLEIISIYFLFKGLSEFFGGRIAFATCFFLATSYGMVSFSRWLSNAAPVMTIGNFVLYLTLLIASGKRKFIPHLFFLTGLAWGFDPAVGFGFLPFGIYLTVRNKPFSSSALIKNLCWFLLPALPQIAFEVRHDFLVTRNLVSFITNPQEGIGFSIRTLSATLRQFLNFLSFAFGYRISIIPLGVIILTTAGLLKNRLFKNPFVSSVLALTLFHVLGLFAFKRGVFEFFYLGTASSLIVLFVLSITNLQNILSRLTIVGLVFYNLILFYHGFSSPGVNLTPIGNENAVTLSARVRVVDYLKTSLAGASYTLWTYNIPYYKEEAWQYLFIWKNIKLPQESGDFLYTLFEPDWINPSRQTAWLSEANQVSQVREKIIAGPFTIEQRIWTKKDK